MSAYVEIQIACGSAEEADAIADVLIGQRLAACAQKFPIRSTYRWQGVIQRDDEILLLVKTRRALVDEIDRAVRAVHSYDVPAITVVEIVAGGADYLSWIDAETTPTI